MEKAFQAFLTCHHVPFGKTHDLGALGAACVDLDSSLDPVAQRVKPLAAYAWKFRYPGALDEPGPIRAIWAVQDKLALHTYQ